MTTLDATANFTASTLDLKLLGIKAAAAGQNLHSVFKFQSSGKRGFKILSFSALQILSLFSPPFFCPFASPISFSRPAPWLQHLHIAQRVSSRRTIGGVSQLVQKH